MSFNEYDVSDMIALTQEARLKLERLIVMIQRTKHSVFCWAIHTLVLIDHIPYAIVNVHYRIYLDSVLRATSCGRAPSVA